MLEILGMQNSLECLSTLSTESLKKNFKTLKECYSFGIKKMFESFRKRFPLIIMKYLHRKSLKKISFKLETVLTLDATV